MSEQQAEYQVYQHRDGRPGYVIETPTEKGEMRWRFQLYLGLETRDGRIVSDADLLEWLETGPDLALHGYTTYRTRGRWQGGNEPSLVLEAIGTHNMRQIMTDLAGAYCHRFNQAEVWLTADPVALHMIRPFDGITGEAA